jgi:alanine racemase
MLAVYAPAEAAALVETPSSVPVLLLMPVRDPAELSGPTLRDALASGRLHLSVHDARQLDVFSRGGHAGPRLAVHVEVDTGMCRGGCAPAEAARVIQRIARECPALRLAGVYTHFASVDGDPAALDAQNDRFIQMLASVRRDLPAGCLIHAASTGAALRCQRYHHDMVRVGQGWAGYGGEGLAPGSRIDGAADLQPALTWRSRVVQTKTVDVGAKVGYGSTWTARRSTLLGLVPVGYADGYPFALGRVPDGSAPSARASVAVLLRSPRGVRRAWAPVVGFVSMDQITIDLTDVAAQMRADESGVDLGATVELITPDREAPNHVTRLALLAGTTPYELLCRLSARVHRIYREEPAPIIETKPAVTAAAVG